MDPQCDVQDDLLVFVLVLSNPASYDYIGLVFVIEKDQIVLITLDGQVLECA